MRYQLAVLAFLVLGAPASSLSAQIAQRVARAPDGPIRMTFANRAEVCGDGTFIGEDTPRGFRMYSFRGTGYSVETLEDVQPECSPGPLRLVVTKTAGRVTDLNAAVGVAWRARSTATDLGTVPAAEAAMWLLDLAQSSVNDRAQTVAFVAANAADSVRISDRLLTMVRTGTLATDSRARALRWASDAARREGRGDEADRVLRTIVRDATDAMAVRDRAVRELDATNANDAFLKETYRAVNETALKDRILRSVGVSRTDENAAWIRGVAADRTESRPLRDRALRVLGEELGRRGELRAMFATLDDAALKDRVLRIVAQPDDSAAGRWLRDVALDAGEAAEVRDRAIRMLAERGASSADLAGLYDRMQTPSLRQRVVRLLVERGDDVAVEKLIQIADRDPDAGQRRYALRRLAETQNPKARTFLEGKVVR